MFKAEAKAEAEENLKALKGRSSSKGVQPLEEGKAKEVLTSSLNCPWL